MACNHYSKVSTVILRFCTVFLYSKFVQNFNTFAENLYKLIHKNDSFA